MSHPRLLASLLFAVAACGPTPNIPHPASTATPVPSEADAAPARTSIDYDDCWRILDGPHLGAQVCRWLEEGASVDEITRADAGGLIVRRGDEVLWSASFDSVARSGAAGSIYVSHRLGDEEQAVMRWCGACDEPRFTELRLMSPARVDAEIRPMRSRLELAIELVHLLESGAVASSSPLLARTVTVEEHDECGEPPFPPARTQALMPGELKTWASKLNRVLTVGDIDCSDSCCTFGGPSLHNHWFITQICFDDAWINRVRVESGC